MGTFASIKELRHSRIFWHGFAVGFTINFGFFAFLIGQWLEFDKILPSNVTEVVNYDRPNTLTIKAQDNTILAQFGDLSHKRKKITEIPEKLQQAFIAIEDSRYYQHNGVDVQGIARATMTNFQSGEVREGGSTITQQLARIVYLDQDRSIERKLKEAVIAQRIDNQLSKEEILQAYLNLVYLGSGAYGVGDAAHRYFSKSLDELTLPEIATIAGITPAPSLYSPLENPDKAKTRRNLVLNRMAQQGYITAEEAQSAIETPLEVKSSPLKRHIRRAPYFVEYIQKEMGKYVSRDILAQGGITINTTLNPQWQEVGEEVVENAVKRYGKWQRFTQGALVTIDPRSGEIRTMVGGVDFAKNQFNRVTQAQRQPGSTFKPFVYATAIAGGMSPEKSYLDAPYVVDGYEPKNYGESYRGDVSIAQALTSSLNVVAVKNLIDVGWNPVIKVAQNMGIQSPLLPTYSLALGASEVNLLELTSAYGTLANQGQHIQVHGIKSIVNAKGEILYEAKFPSQTALDKNSANITTWMLQRVVRSGTGVPAQIGRPVAGKTGTSDKARDLWFIGYIPQLATGIWVGNDNNGETRGSSAITAQMWRNFMLKATDKMPIQNFGHPPGRLVLDKPTIKLEPLKPRESYHKTTLVQETHQELSQENRRRRRRRRDNT
ncbi:transglycosylase domain-containing protein [Geminocystis sp. CENA526]|uniref:transglycosylase domain-containing protein n=1 Tax=Geminocystis sp. CENA526 TaxID=1355871 RepID=UPI003D6FDD83